MISVLFLTFAGCVNPGRAKMTHQSRKNYKISCFEVPDVFFRGLKASSVVWKSFIEA
jgi:hypothetical protein